MNNAWSYKSIPPSRIATFDTFSIGLLKHHVSALLEFDVTESRKKLHDLRMKGTNVSFNGWIFKVISSVLQKHPEASAFLYSKRKLIIFSDINISVIVEKKLNNKKVPIPVLIEKVNRKSAKEITAEIESAKNREISNNDFVLNKKTSRFESLYSLMPGFIRRFTWKLMLRNPKLVYKKMGNAVITAPGMMGKVNGWFIHKSIHPISFGIGSIIKKPVVIDNEVKIREILNMTILIDHDVIDGAPMVRLLNDLTTCIEKGEFTDGTAA
jgi:pyruvate/2-oxoglutarate dehydrogenase complex dihydrolipoamide acyltransferase (E2) component